MPTYAVRRTSFLAHHGILGQKWGIRRFQKTDGTLTSAGKKRYKTGNEKEENSESSLTTYSPKELKLKNKSRKSKSAYDKFWAEMERQTDTSHIKDKTEKLKREHKILDGWMDEDDESKNASLSIALQIKVTRDVFDGYNHEAKTKATKEQITKIDELSAKANKELKAGNKDLWRKTADAQVKLEQDLCGIALKEIGYEDDPRSRKMMEHMLWYD